MGWLGDAAGAVGDFVSDHGSAIIGAGAGIFGTMQQNAANAAITQKQMDFQKHMYKHRYQYQMQDMREAGLNPILAAGQAPPGAPGGAGIPARNVMEGAVATAQDVKRTAAVVKQADAELKRTAADEQLKKSQAKHHDALSYSEFFNASSAIWNAKSAEEAYNLRRMEVDRFKKHGDSFFGRMGGTMQRYVERLSDFAQGTEGRRAEFERWLRSTKPDRSKRP